MKKLIIYLSFFLFLAGSAYAIGTVAQSGPSSVGDFKVVVLTFAADSSDGSVPSTAIGDQILDQIKGMFLHSVETDPGTNSPTNLYDIVINDANGLDIMGGNLADRSDTNTDIAFPATASRPIDGSLQFVLSNNSVNSATGTVKLYFTKSPTIGTLTISGGGDATAANQTAANALLTTIAADTSAVADVIIDTLADSIANTQDTIPVASFNICYDSVADDWNRCPSDAGRGSATATSPVPIAALAESTESPAVDDGDDINFMTDLVGRQIFGGWCTPGNVVWDYVEITNDTETEVLAGAGASTYMYVVYQKIIQKGTTATELNWYDDDACDGGGTEIDSDYVSDTPPSGVVKALGGIPVLKVPTANQKLCVKATTTGANVSIKTIGCKSTQ